MWSGDWGQGPSWGELCTGTDLQACGDHWGGTSSVPKPVPQLPSTAKIFSCSCFWMLPSAVKLSTLNTWSCEGTEPMASSSCLALDSWKAPPTCSGEAGEEKEPSSLSAWAGARRPGSLGAGKRAR